MLGHASDPGTVLSVLALHDYLLSVMTDCDEQSAITYLQSAQDAESVFGW
jgi:hypothetical protein